MSLPKSIVAVKFFYKNINHRENYMHLFEGEITGFAICGVGGTPVQWSDSDKSDWDRYPKHQCGRCDYSLRKRERAALREKV